MTTELSILYFRHLNYIYSISKIEAYLRIGDTTENMVQCQFCRKRLRRVDVRHYRVCICIPEEEREDFVKEYILMSRGRVLEMSRVRTERWRRNQRATQQVNEIDDDRNDYHLHDHAQSQYEEDMEENVPHDMNITGEDPELVEEAMVGGRYPGFENAKLAENKGAKGSVVTALDAVLLDTIPDLSKKKADTLLSALYDYIEMKDFTRPSIFNHGKGIDGFNKYIKIMSNREDLVKTLGLTYEDQEFYIHHIKDEASAANLITEMVQKSPTVGMLPTPMKDNSTSSRMYGLVSWGNWMENTYKKLQVEHPGALLLPIGFFSDKTLTRSRRKSLWPVTMFLPTQDASTMFKDNGSRIIGHIPEVKIRNKSSRSQEVLHLKK